MGQNNAEISMKKIILKNIWNIIRIIYTISINVVTIMYLLSPTPARRMVYVGIITINIIIRVIKNYYVQQKMKDDDGGEGNEK